jgi:hypothetical protein
MGTTGCGGTGKRYEQDAFGGSVHFDCRGCDDCYRDALHTTTVVRLSWLDRCKVLVGFPLYVSVGTRTQGIIGRTDTSSRAWTPPLFPERALRAALTDPDDGAKGGDGES